MIRPAVVLPWIAAMTCVAALAACGSQPSGCGPHNCADGCCDGALCMSGKSTLACGSGGEACVRCGANMQCSAGICIAGTGGGAGGGTGGGRGGSGTCNAANCTGCCQGNTCQPGNTASACGKSGAACVQCGANQVCRADQTCGVDPTSMWRVQPVRATIAATNNGSAWDGDGSAPDVYVALDCPPIGNTWDSSTASVESLSPTWNAGGCIARAADLIVHGFDFQVWDEDIAAHDTITGALNMKATQDNFVSGTININASGGMQSMTVQLQRQ